MAERQEKEPLMISEVRKYLDYDLETGEFRWRERNSKQWNGRYAHKIAGSVCEDGYTVIGLFGRLFKAHQLAWLYVYGVQPDCDIDHVDNNRSNNAIHNLRLASRSQNLANSWREEKSTTGFKGVSFRKRRKPFAAHIKHNGKSKYLGSFETREEAHAAYCAAADKTFGDFANFGHKAA